MNDKPQNQDGNNGQDDQNKSTNANSAYSGSGSWQPGGDTGEAGKLSSYGTTDEVQQQTNSIPGNQTDRPYTADDANITVNPAENEASGETEDSSGLSGLEK